MLYAQIYFCLLLILVFSCNSNTNQQHQINSQEKEKLDVEIQAQFSVDQLTAPWLAELANFRMLKGNDRMDIYEKIEQILPECNMTILNDHEADIDREDCQQQMTVLDLKEMLGAADEVREDASQVYYLSQDASYRLVFFCESNGIVYSRALEADS